MEKTTFYDAYTFDDDHTIQFTILVPGEPDPAKFHRLLHKLFTNEIYFCAGSFDLDCREGGDQA